jgi:Virulence-associated protein E
MGIAILRHAGRSGRIREVIPMTAVINTATIPAELRAIPHWHHWKPEIRDGKTTKVPKVSGENRNASSTNPATWTDFETAVTKLNGDGRGLGWALTEPDGLVFIDLDGCVDPETGVIAPWAQGILSRLNSYAERSPNAGVHVWVRGKLPAEGNKVGAIEMYSSGRYATVTGNRIEGTPETIQSVNVDWLHRLMVARTFDFEKNSKLAALMAGDTTGYASPSEADLALCSLLARLGLNEESIADAVSISRLWDAKWERDDYRQRTIEKALSQPQPVLKVRPIRADGDWRSELITNTKGTPLHILANAVTAIRNDLALGDLISYDTFAQRIISQRPTPWQTGPGGWEDFDDSQVCIRLSQQHGIHVPTRLAMEAAEVVARGRTINPLTDFLDDCARDWDGQLRVESWLARYAGAADSAYNRAVGKAFLIGGVARAFRPGCKFDYCMVLEGDQGTLKSTLIETLAGKKWFKVCSAALGTKDSFENMLGVWLHELAELDHVRGANLERLKSFLSCSEDHYRKSYGRRARTCPRTTTFIGTTNLAAYLNDETGGRRFWPVKTGTIKIDDLARDRSQLWGEAVHAYRAGERWWLTPEIEKLAKVEVEQRFESGPWDDLISRWLDRLGDAREEVRRVKQFESNPLPWFGSTSDRISISDAIIHGVGKDVPARGDEMLAARFLRHAGWERKRETAGPFRNRYFYFRPKGGAE